MWVARRAGSHAASTATATRRIGAATKATVPERIDKVGAGPNDATKPLGTRTMTLKFVMTRLDTYMGQRMSVSGMLIGAGGTDGINVTTVNRVAENCP